MEKSRETSIRGSSVGVSQFVVSIMKTLKVCQVRLRLHRERSLLGMSLLDSMNGLRLIVPRLVPGWTTAHPSRLC